MLAASLLLALSSAFPPMSAPSQQVVLGGFTAKGELTATELFVYAAKPLPVEYTFTCVFDANGALVKIAEYTDHDEKKQSVQGQALVKAAKALGAKRQTQLDPVDEHDDKPVDADLQPFAGPKGEVLTLAVKPDGKECALVATWAEGDAKLSGEVARDRCGDSTVQAAFPSGGGRAAVSWNLPGIGQGEDIDRRGHVAWVSARGLATVEILDAGAGKDAVDAAIAKAAAAGFHAEPKGAAKGKRAASAVYARAGFEAQAKAVAELIGATEVAPRTWDSRAAITIALAK